MRLSSVLAAAAISAQTFAFPLIPVPSTLRVKEGTFRFDTKTRIAASSKDLAGEGDVFAEIFAKRFGFALRAEVRKKPAAGCVWISLRDDEKDESYSLSIARDGISLSGGRAGIFYGFQTLCQLLTRGDPEVPCLEIDDAPRFSWRGMHLDVCRHFFPVEFVKKYIDYIAMYKMNMFHLHLTEDQGWRIEIRKYPRLTEIGAWRNGSMIGPYDAQKFDSIRYGGFYSQDDIRELVRYAQKRHITIVPEIEMPGHSVAALASYPELSCTGGPFDVARGWGVFDDVYCPKEHTFEFLENVLSEVCDLFPGKYVHIGGDECPKTRWKSCAYCQELMKKEGLKDENELQSYFIRRIEKFLNSKGKQIVGWDEILDGGLAPNATVMSWRGTDGGIAAARQKHSAVMSPGGFCYFDHYQGFPQDEPLAIGGYTTVEKVYSYEPVPTELSVDEQRFIRGAQGNVWTEYITSPRQVEYMAMPRMAALSEVLWSPREARDYKNFQKRLFGHFHLLDEMDVNYSRSVFQVAPKVSPAPDGVSVELSSPLDSSSIFFTLDGSPPSTGSARYSSPIHVTSDGALKFLAVGADGQEGRSSTREFHVSKSTGKSVVLKTPPHKDYYGSGAFSLVDGVLGDSSSVGQGWIGWWGPDLEAVIDLGQPVPVSQVSMNFVASEASWIYPPKSFEVFSGTDSLDLISVGKLSFDKIARSGSHLFVKFDSRPARFVKVVALNSGKIPAGKPGAGSDSWLFADEIEVK